MSRQTLPLLKKNVRKDTVHLSNFLLFSLQVEG